MQSLITFFQEILTKTGMAVIQSFAHNWIPLSFAILTAAVLSVYIDTNKLKDTLLKRTHVSIWASVIVGAFTPFCACGTMAVVIGMLTTTLPWGPIMAFLTSSPLMSPDGFILVAGIISLKFAIALTIASIVIGLGSGYITHLIEKKTDFLKNQTRFAEKSTVQTCSCSDNAKLPEQAFQTCCTNSGSLENFDTVLTTGMNVCKCDSSVTSNLVITTKPSVFNIFGFVPKIKWREIWESIINLGVKQILPNFALFVVIGFLVNYFVPTSIIMALFSAKNIFAVPLAALIGLPLYVNGESAIPLIKSLMAGGAGGGAMLAFLITGPGTSAWVIAGIATFMKKRIIGLYVFYLLAGGILLGYLYDLLLAIGL